FPARPVPARSEFRPYAARAAATTRLIRCCDSTHVEVDVAAAGGRRSDDESDEREDLEGAERDACDGHASPRLDAAGAIDLAHGDEPEYEREDRGDRQEEEEHD